jgi:lysophospholipase L1-like esterase
MGRRTGACCVIVLLASAVSVLGQGAPSSEAPGVHGPVVLFQGDSITDGGRWRTGHDFNHIMGQDYAYILAGEIGAKHPELHLEFVNRGVGGDRVLDLAARWKADTLDLQPQVLSILIGVNDTLAERDKAESVATFKSTYDKLLADTIAALPHTKIILGEPFLLPVGKYAADYAEQRAEVEQRAAVVAELAAKYKLPEVMYQEAFDAACKRAPAATWSWDGVHPTYAGHWLMSREWLKTAKGLGWE